MLVRLEAHYFLELMFFQVCVGEGYLALSHTDPGCFYLYVFILFFTL